MPRTGRLIRTAPQAPTCGRTSSLIHMPQLRQTAPATRDRSSRPLLAGLVALSLLAMGAAIAEYLVPVSARVWVANAAWLISSVVALTGVSAVRRRSATRDRPGWTLLECACAAWMIG